MYKYNPDVSADSITEYTKQKEIAQKNAYDVKLTKIFQKFGLDFCNMEYISMYHRPRSSTYYKDINNNKIYEHKNYFMDDGSSVVELSEENDA
jgi:hypothetical protein